MTIEKTLKDVAHAQSNELHDVAALLVAITQMSEKLDDDVCRLLNMTSAKVYAIQEAFEPYI